MKNLIVVKNNNNETMTIELLLDFKIESIGKEYIVYTINDNDESETVNVIISEIKYDGEIPVVVPIKEDEKEMVFLFYDRLRKSN